MGKVFKLPSLGLSPDGAGTVSLVPMLETTAVLYYKPELRHRDGIRQRQNYIQDSYVLEDCKGLRASGLQVLWGFLYMYIYTKR